MATNKLLKKCSLSSFFFIRYASSYRHVVVEDQGLVRIVTINRPENRNCVNSQTANELYDAFNKFEQDESSLVGILAGKGGTFCAGYDLKEVSSADERLDVLLKPFSMDEKGPMVIIMYLYAYIYNNNLFIYVASFSLGSISSPPY